MLTCVIETVNFFYLEKIIEKKCKVKKIKLKKKLTIIIL